jgi:hypothetical protein
MKKPLTKEQFLDALNKGKKGYAQKPKSWQKIWYWWEDPKDPWFMNIYKSEKRGEFNPGKGNWVIAKDLDNWLDSDERSGYKFYIDE